MMNYMREQMSSSDEQRLNQLRNVSSHPKTRIWVDDVSTGALVLVLLTELGIKAARLADRPHQKAPIAASASSQS